METSGTSRPFSNGSIAFRFEAASTFLYSQALSKETLIEPELVEWMNRATAKAAPVTRPPSNLQRP